MTDLTAIVRATRASANAVKQMQHAIFAMREGNETQQAYAAKQHAAAFKRYQRAQATLAANPLPGDADLSNLS